MIAEMDLAVTKTNRIKDSRKTVRKKTYRFLRVTAFIGMIGYGSFVGYTEYIDNRSTVDRFISQAYKTAVDYSKEAVEYVNRLRDKF